MIILITLVSFFGFIVVFNLFSKITAKKTSAIDDLYLAARENEAVVSEILTLIKSESSTKTLISYPKKYTFSRDWGDFVATRNQHSNIAERIIVRSDYSESKKVSTKSSGTFQRASQRGGHIQSRSTGYIRKISPVSQDPIKA